MLTTNLLTAQSIGTGANTGPGLFAGQVTLSATTTAHNLSARWNPTSGQPMKNPATTIRLFFGTSSFAITSAQAVLQLPKAVSEIDLNVPTAPAQPLITDSPLMPLGGTVLYYWLDVPASAVADTLDLNLVELN